MASLRPRALAVGALVAGSLVVAAGGATSNEASGRKDTSTGAAATSPASTSPAAAGTPVVIDTFMFSPKALKVKVGDTVVWTNHDSILHTVTSGTRQYDPGDSGQVTATHKDGTFDMPLDGK